VKALALALGVIGLGTGLWAQEAATAPNLDLSFRAEVGAVGQLLAAQDLFALAQVQRDPLAALAAARLRAGISVTAVSRDPVAGSQGPALTLPDAAQMFDLAQRLSLDDDLAVLIEVERVGAAVAAPWTVEATGAAIAPLEQDRWDLAFFAGALAEVAVLGAGTAVLDIRVTDAAGNLICQQLGPRDRLYCPFVPTENGRFSVLVSNPGGDLAPYSLFTN
jgi:hypothetical protein